MIFWKFQIWETCPGPIFHKPANKTCVLKNPVLPGSKIPLLAIHKIISHIWEDAPRKVNNGEFDFSFFHGNFDLLSAGQFENLVFRPQSQGGQICVSWAHPLGPGLGPPTWAQLGPTHLDFQAPPAPAPDEFSNPDPGPSQRTQG